MKKAITKLIITPVNQLILREGRVMRLYWLCDELIDRLNVQGWIRHDRPDSWDYITANDDGDLVVLRISDKKQHEEMKALISTSPLYLMDYDCVTPQMIYKGLLQCKSVNMSPKQLKAFNQIYWVVNLTDCTKAVEIVKAYAKEFELMTAGVVRKVLGIDLNECGIIYSDAY